VHDLAVSRRILLVNDDPKQLKWWSRIVRALHAEPMPGGYADLDAGVDLAVVNYDKLPTQSLGPWRERLMDPSSRSHVLMVTEGRCPSGQYAQLFAGGLTNLLATNGELAAIDFIVTLQKILRGDIFGIEKYFSWGVEPLRIVVRRSTDKQMVLEQAADFAQTLRVHPPLVERFLTVVDELVSNAFYNAPVDAQGRRVFSSLPRSNPVELEGDKAIEVSFCCDGLRLGVAAADPFGSLQPSDALKYLARCLQGKTAEVSRDGGGAGLGFFIMFDAVTHLVINVRPGIRTEVLGVIDVQGTFRDFVAQGKSFNIFT
jgi:hypothetical protein